MHRRATRPTKARRWLVGGHARRLETRRRHRTRYENKRRLWNRLRPFRAAKGGSSGNRCSHPTRHRVAQGKPACERPLDLTVAIQRQQTLSVPCWVRVRRDGVDGLWRIVLGAFAQLLCCVSRYIRRFLIPSSVSQWISKHSIIFDCFRFWAP